MNDQPPRNPGYADLPAAAAASGPHGSHWDGDSAAREALPLDWPVFQDYITAASADNERLFGGEPARRAAPGGHLETLCDVCGEQSWEAWRTGFCAEHYPGGRY